MMDHRSIVVIGGGAGGSLAALQFAARSAGRGGVPPVLVDPAAEPGEGLAYGPGATRSLLLNIPAGRMSLFAEDPDHFVRWVREWGERLGWVECREVGADRYLSRRLYGAYVRQTVAEAKEAGTVTHVRGKAVRLDAGAEGWWMVHLEDGTVIPARAVVLALGNGKPVPPSFDDPDHLIDSPFFQRDPWDVDRPGPAGGDPVLLLGTGLTMVDWALRLGRRATRGAPIHAVSRRGWLSLERGESAPAPPPFGPEDADRGIVWLTRRLRAACSAPGADWRSVIDGLRPITQDLWRGLSPEDKRRFVRLAQSAWNIHRHRMPRESAEGIRNLIADRRLVIHPGRVTRLRQCSEARVAATVALAGGGEVVLPVARVICCTGADTGFGRRGSSLVDGMLRDGLVRSDGLDLGLDASSDGTLSRADGGPSRGLFGLGPVLRGSRWECTAIPDIREQARDLADILYSRERTRAPVA